MVQERRLLGYFDCLRPYYSGISRFWGGRGLFKAMSISIPNWSNDVAGVGGYLAENLSGIIALFAVSGAAFTAGGG